MKDVGRLIGALKDEGYWYAFLEQCVQVVDRKLKDEEFTTTATLGSTIDRLNKKQESYEFPSRDDLQNAVDNEEEVLGQEIKPVFLATRHGL